jgi:hypothetical protein
MPTLTENPLAEVKEGLATNFELVEGLTVLGYEPTQAPALPLLTMQTRGFVRAKLDSDEVQGPIVDPLMGRRWVWRLYVRVWVALKSDPEAAQDEQDALIAKVVSALESDRSLGGVANDSTLASGESVIVRPQSGQAMLMLTCDCQVETEEPLNT